MRRGAAAAAFLAAGLASAVPTARAQSPVVLQRELLYLLAEINYQLFLARRQDERLLLALAALQLQALNPTLSTVAGTAMNVAGINESSEAMSCPVFVGTGTLLGEDTCLWSKVTGQRTNQFSTDTDSVGLRIGGQAELAPGWFLGGTLSTGTSWQQAEGTNTTARGQSAGGSVAVKRVQGPWLLAGALGFSTTWNRMTRQGVGLANGQMVQADINASFAGLRLRGAYDFAFDGWYVRPRLDVAASYTWMPGFTETGPAGGVFSYAAQNKIGAMLAPIVELGGRIDLGERTILRPYLAAGPQFVPDNTWRVVASFTGPLSYIGSFSQTFVGPSVLATVEAGLQLYDAQGLDLRAEYKLAAGYSILSQTASLRLGWRF